MPHRILIAAAIALFASPAYAIDIYTSDDEARTLELSGYARVITGEMIPSDDVEEAFGGLIGQTGTQAQTLRLEWTANLGENLTLDLHERLTWSLQSGGGTEGLSMFSSAQPDASLDLSSTIVDPEEHPGHAFVHDIDRLAVHGYLRQADVTLGRQAISWGQAMLFPVADVWSVLSPFDLDNTEKRGIDALRVIAPAGELGEWDLVVADRGDLEDLSAGIRYNRFMPSGDAYGALLKTYNDLRALVGYAHFFPTWVASIEASVPYAIDDEAFRWPRVTTGAEWFSGDWMVNAELHFSGDGAEPGEYYLEHIAESPTHTQGEVYLFGQYYAGATVSYQWSELTNVSAVVMGNLQDPSVMIAPQITHSLGQDVDLALGMFRGVGEGPNGIPMITPNFETSEFGLYGSFYYGQMVAYW